MADTCGISTLLKAWRERWTPLQWLVEVKKNAKKEDQKGLADCLVQQSTFGTTPTMLILSYLKHGVLAEVIPSSKALEAIQKFQNIEKHRCLTALLDLLISIIPNLSCHDDDDALALAVAMVKLIYWLLIIDINLLKLSREASRASDETNLHYHLGNAKRCHKAFTQLMSSQTYRSLIIVGKLQETDVIAECDFQFQAHMKEFYVASQSEGMTPEIQLNFKELMIDYNRLHNLTPSNGSAEVQPGTIPNMAVQNIIHILNLKFLSHMPEKIADLLEAVMRTQNITRPQLYLEVLRSCLVGLLDSQSQSMEEALWTGFFFLKLPKILNIMETRYQSQSSSPTLEHTLMQATLTQLRVFSPLLDDCDLKFRCNTYKEFIDQYCKYVPQQVSDRLNNLSSSRNISSEVQNAISSGQGHLPLKLLLDAESKVVPVLKLLESSDTTKDDQFLNELSSLFKVTHSRWKLVAVASLNKMQSLVSALIRLSEETKHPNDTDEENTACELRGDLFNAAFIILCHIAQVFGQEVVVDVARSCDLEEAFMTQWIKSHIPESDKERTFFPNPQYPANPAMVGLIMKQFQSKGPFLTSDARWDDLCSNSPVAMHEMLKSWQYEPLICPAETIQSVCNCIKFEVPAWAICVCAWCCGYIHELRMEQRGCLTGERTDATDRPPNLGLLQFLLTPINAKGMPSSFNDRSSMMVEVMKCMSANIERKDETPTSNLPVDINQTPTKTMKDLFHNCVKHKQFSTKVLHKFKQLLVIGGPDWFCSTIIKELLSFSRQESIAYAADVSSCLMLLDTKLLVPVLIRQVIPRYLHHSNANVILQDPKGWGIARLAAHAVNWGLLCEQTQQTNKQDKGESNTEQKISLTTTKPSSTIQQSLVGLCEELVAVVEDNKVGPVASVLKNFLQQAAQCSNPISGSLLSCLPTELTQNLVGLTPLVCCTPDVILGICSLQSVDGRKLCARVLCRTKPSV